MAGVHREAGLKPLRDGGEAPCFLIRKIDRSRRRQYPSGEWSHIKTLSSITILNMSYVANVTLLTVAGFAFQPVD